MAVGLRGDLKAFQTERLDIRPIDIDDAPAVHRVTDHPEITQNISFLPTPTSLRDVRQLITGDGDEWRMRMLGGWGRSTETLAVVIGYMLHGSSELEIGFWTAPSFQKQNLTHEAMSGVLTHLCRQHPERTVTAECRPNNIAAWKLLEKLGFASTGEAGRKPLRRRLVFQRPIFDLLSDRG